MVETTGAADIRSNIRYDRMDTRMNNNYLCTSKHYGHVYNFFRRVNPLRGGLGLELETSVGPVK